MPHQHAGRTANAAARLEPRMCVMQTFARHGIPLAAPLAPPILNVSITCPGACQCDRFLMQLCAARMLL
jgi:hypothetical protein